MASGIHYYQRVGTLDSLQNDILGRDIVDPHNQRVFKYVKVVEADVQALRGSPLGAVGKQWVSAGNVIADFSSVNNGRFIGINVNSTMSDGHYGWIMTKGWLGADSQSDVFKSMVYVRTDGTGSNERVLLFNDDRSAETRINHTHGSLKEIFSGVAGGVWGADSAGSTAASAIDQLYSPRNIGLAVSTDSGNAQTKGFVHARFQV